MNVEIRLENTVHVKSEVIENAIIEESLRNFNIEQEMQAHGTNSSENNSINKFYFDNGIKFHDSLNTLPGDRYAYNADVDAFVIKSEVVEDSVNENKPMKIFNVQEENCNKRNVFGYYGHQQELPNYQYNMNNINVLQRYESHDTFTQQAVHKDVNAHLNNKVDSDYRKKDDMNGSTSAEMYNAHQENLKMDPDGLDHVMANNFSSKNLLEYYERLQGLPNYDYLNGLNVDGGYDCQDAFSQDTVINTVNPVDKKHKCPKCYRTFAYNKNMKMHLVDCPGATGKHTCFKCNREFRQKGNLNVHIQKMHAKTAKKYNCDECNKAFSHKLSVQYHKDRVHQRSIKKYTCEQCLHEYSAINYLRRHVRIVHGGLAEKFTCDQCQREFSHKQTLKLHIQMVHQTFRKFKCKECPRGYVRKNDLNVHIGTAHRGIKRVECDECNRMYSTKEYLKIHIASMHRNIKRYQCGECHSAFPLKNGLRIHIRTVHKSVKHKCNECERSYINKSYLNFHIDAVHRNINKFKCDKCPLEFRYKIHLKSHNEKNHANQESVNESKGIN